MTSKPQSRKAKGRRLQQWVRDKLLHYAPWLTQDDVRSTSMGAPGEDVLLSPLARRAYPVSIECKNTERISIWSAYTQAQENAGEHEPLLIIKRNRNEPLAVVDAEWLISMLGAYEGHYLTYSGHL